MDTPSISDQVACARRQAGLTQEELADRCKVHVRTIQRIEANKVKPRMHTIRLLNDALGGTLVASAFNGDADRELENFRAQYRRRRSARIGIFIASLTLMIGVTLIAFPSWELLGMSKLTWAPFFYLLMFGLISSVAWVWTCPACHGQLGDVFRSKYCPNCGLKFEDDSRRSAAAMAPK